MTNPQLPQLDDPLLSLFAVARNIHCDLTNALDADCRQASLDLVDAVDRSLDRLDIILGNPCVICNAPTRDGANRPVECRCSPAGLSPVWGMAPSVPGDERSEVTSPDGRQGR